MGHLEEVLLKLEWAYKVLKFGETKEPEKAEIPECKLDIDFSMKESKVTFNFIDLNNQIVAVKSANIPNLNPADIRLLCYFKAREESKQKPIDKEDIAEPIEKLPKCIEILAVNSI